MSSASKNVTALPVLSRGIDHDVVMAALPHPILVINADDRTIYANAAAEHFFSTSQALLKRQTLSEMLGKSSPLVALIAQVRRTGATVNEYGIDISIPRVAATRLVDVYGGPVQEQSQHILLMMQQRSMAQMIERTAFMRIELFDFANQRFTAPHFDGALLLQRLQ